MLDHEDGDTARLSHVENEARHVFLFLLIHAGHRLVEDEELWLCRKRARKLHALLESKRHDVNRLVADCL